MVCRKKDAVDQNKNADMDEWDADAISCTPIKLMFGWAVYEGNIFI